MLSGFDRVARIYRWGEYASFGPFLSRTRSAHLSDFANTQHALILGDGDGRFTHLALRTYPHLHVTAVDMSAEMLALLSKRCEPYEGRLQTVQADVTTFDFSTIGDCGRNVLPVDTIVTHFFLDCLTTPQVERLIAQLATPTRWIVSDFHIPTGLLKLPSQAIVHALYAAFRLLTGLRTQKLPDWQQALRSAGWRLHKHSSFLGSLLIAETWRRGETLRTMHASHLTGE